MYDDGTSISTPEFEWVMGPVIKDGQVIGASRIWRTDACYSGPRKGENVRYVSNETYDADNPGHYISVGELKKASPQCSK